MLVVPFSMIRGFRAHESDLNQAATDIALTGLSAGALGTVTWSFVPSKATAVFGSLVRRPGWLSVGPPLYVPVLVPALSAALVPEVSPRRQ